MTATDFIPSTYKNLPESGSVSWKTPSNIALIKYWGKKENQIPTNPSISFTLQHCVTTTTLQYKKLENLNPNFSFDLFFDAQPAPDFKPKILTFFQRIYPYLPFLNQYHFTIHTSNSFPHSSGIASSASAFGALACCLLSIEKSIQKHISDEFFTKKASFLARLGSGSASRSIEGGLIVWGKHKTITGSSDLFGIRYPYEVHPVFRNYQDTILLVHKGKKEVSSSLGHQLMHNHPFAEKRFQQANKYLDSIQKILKKGDLKQFIQLVETEALTLHAMMMTSSPYFILMQPNTLEIIHKIWEFRKATQSHICFTLDAGANVHLLYPKSEKEQILQFIENELVVYCEDEQYICDEVGIGAEQLTTK